MNVISNDVIFKKENPFEVNAFFYRDFGLWFPILENFRESVGDALRLIPFLPM